MGSSDRCCFRLYKMQPILPAIPFFYRAPRLAHVYFSVPATFKPFLLLLFYPMYILYASNLFGFSFHFSSFFNVDISVNCAPEQLLFIILKLGGMSAFFFLTGVCIDFFFLNLFYSHFFSFTLSIVYFLFMYKKLVFVYVEYY